MRATSRSASTRVQGASRPHAGHVQRALRACPGSHSLESGPPRARQLRVVGATRSALTPSGLHAPLPASHARLSARQQALAFNQPLSFGTSKRSRPCTPSMFYVRSARALCAPAVVSGPSPCVPLLRRRHPTCNALPPPGPHLFPHCMPAFRLARQGLYGVRPAAQLRHVQGHGHDRHVQRALHACPGPPQP